MFAAQVVHNRVALPGSIAAAIDRRGDPRKTSVFDGPGSDLALLALALHPGLDGRLLALGGEVALERVRKLVQHVPRSADVDERRLDLVRRRTGALPDEWQLALVQRDVKWDEVRIASLLDSLLSGYPIGALLVCRVRQGGSVLVSAGDGRKAVGVDEDVRPRPSLPRSLSDAYLPSSMTSPTGPLGAYITQ